MNNETKIPLDAPLMNTPLQTPCASPPLINTPLQRGGSAEGGNLPRATNHLSLTPRFSGVETDAGGPGNRFSGFPTVLETAEAVPGPRRHTLTPLKRGVNESAFLPALLAALVGLLTSQTLFAAVPPQHIICPPGQALVKVPDTSLLSTQGVFQLSFACIPAPYEQAWGQ